MTWSADLGKSELPVHPAITEAMVDAVRDHERASAFENAIDWLAAYLEGGS